MKNPAVLPCCLLLMWACLPAAFAVDLPTSDKAILNTGFTLYHTHCADCHGADASGGAADSLKATLAVPDLTRLAARNGGVFPFWELYDVISGAELFPAHAGRTMPIWSQELAQDPAAAETDAQSLVRGRILAIIAWLSSVQAENQ